jgi:hypothetical protein
MQETLFLLFLRPAFHAFLVERTRVNWAGGFDQENSRRKHNSNPFCRGPQSPRCALFGGPYPAARGLIGGETSLEHHLPRAQMRTPLHNFDPKNDHNPQRYFLVALFFTIPFGYVTWSLEF